MRAVERQSSGTFKVRYRLDGKQTSMTFATKPEAEEFQLDLAKLGAAAAVRRLDQRTTDANAMTVEQLWRSFITWKAPRVRSDRTIAEYEAAWRIWIRPTFGGRPAADVRPQDVQEWVDAMVAGKLARKEKKAAAKSILGRHALLYAMFTYACAPSRALLETNPTIGTELPKKRDVPPKALTPPEYQALAAALRQINPDAADLADFLVASGWRWSEATAISTYDVEDYGDAMYVSVQRVLRRNAANQWRIVEDVKASGSARRIQLDAAAADLVRRRIQDTPPGELVFRSSTGRQWHYAHFMEDNWDPAVKAANLGRRPTVHWLRHSHVLWGVLSGANLAELSSRIGHRHISTTIDVYGKAVTDVQPETLAKMAALRGAVPNGAPKVLEAVNLTD